MATENALQLRGGGSPADSRSTNVQEFKAKKGASPKPIVFNVEKNGKGVNISLPKATESKDIRLRFHQTTGALDSTLASIWSRRGISASTDFSELKQAERVANAVAGGDGRTPTP